MEEHRQFLATWGKMDLSHVFGFPMWEKEVHLTLQEPSVSTAMLVYCAVEL